MLPASYTEFSRLPHNLRDSARSRRACLSARPQGSLNHSCFPNSNALSLTRSTAKLLAVEMTSPPSVFLIQLRITLTLYIWYCVSSGFGPHLCAVKCLSNSSTRSPLHLQPE